MKLSYDERSTLDLIRIDQAARAYFFMKLGENPDSKWFDTLLSRGYFAVKENPRPVQADTPEYASMPYWQVLPYLVGLSKRTQDPDFPATARKLVEIICNVAEAEVTSDPSQDNIHTWAGFVEIMTNLPVDLLERPIGYVRRWIGAKYGGNFVGTDVVTKLLPRLLQSQEPGPALAERVIDNVTEIVWKPLPEVKRALYPGRTEDADLLVEPFWMKEAFIHKGYAKEAGSKCSVSLVSRVAAKLRNLLVKLYPERTSKEPPDDMSILWYNSIATGPAAHEDDSEQVLTSILRDLASGKAETSPAEGRAVLAALLSPELDLPVFRRIALHVASLRWDDLRDELMAPPDAMVRQWLALLPFEQEMIALLKRAKSAGGDPFFARVRRLVGSIEDGYVKDKWTRTLAGEDVEPVTSIRFETRVGPGPSPMTESDILEQSGDALATYLHSFREKNAWDGPTVGGLSETLKNAVKQNPSRFVEKLGDLTGVTYLYAESILWGFWDAWKEKRAFDWGGVLAYASRYVHRSDFWSDAPVTPGEHFPTRHRNAVGMIAELLISGTEKDAWAMDREHNRAAEQLLFYLFDRMTPERPPKWDDPLAEALNTTSGKLLQAMLYMALRKSRLSRGSRRAEGIRVWSLAYQERFQRAIDGKNQQAHTYLGYYLYNFLYLDSAWTEGLVDRLAEEPNRDEELWFGFVYGFLFRQNINPEVYRMMVPHFQRVWVRPGLPENTERGLVNVVLTAYLRDYEQPTEGTLTHRLLADWQPKRLEIAMQFLVSVGRMIRAPEGDEKGLAEAEKVKLQGKSMDFWRRVLETGTTRAGEPETAKVLSAVTGLTVFLDELDGPAWSMLSPSLSYLQPGHDTVTLLRHLVRLTDSADGVAVSYAGDVLLKVIERFHPDYDRSHIVTLVERLFGAGDPSSKEKAERICESYTKQGMFFLKDVYDDYKGRRDVETRKESGEALGT